jgi:hypothetical protein
MCYVITFSTVEPRHYAENEMGGFFLRVQFPTESAPIALRLAVEKLIASEDPMKPVV